jgi:flagellar FliL protein
MSEQHPTPEPAPAAATSGMMSKITVLALILAVIVGECLAAFLFLGPSEPAAAAHAPEKSEAKSAALHGKSGDGGGHSKKSHGSGDSYAAKGRNSQGEQSPQNEQKEVDLGEYSIMATDPASSTMLLVDFHIFGTVATQDSAEFERLYEESRHRIRHQVIIIVRSAEMSDLTDASLGLIRRQILERTNQLLGKPLVQEIIFSKFSFLEQ